MPLQTSGKQLLFELQFLPGIEYFSALVKYSNVLFDQHEHFVKQTYRNRCHILGANGTITLIVPVVKGSQKTAMQYVEIDYSHKWVAPLWRSILSAYGKSPFFEFYSDDLKQILMAKPQHLWDLNLQLLSYCLKCLDMDISFTFTDKYFDPEESSISDKRGQIHPKVDFSRNLLYFPYSYTQIFGNKFVPNLSIIDLLFCEGPNAREILKRSELK